MGSKLKLVREEARITQKELADKSGVSRTIISGIESGRVKTTTTDTLIKIANALEKKVSDIFFD